MSDPDIDWAEIVSDSVGGFGFDNTSVLKRLLLDARAVEAEYWAKKKCIYCRQGHPPTVGELGVYHWPSRYGSVSCGAPEECKRAAEFYRKAKEVRDET